MAKNAQDLSPKEIVAELDRYVVGQGKAKRAVAIALRNRWRRQKVAEDLRDDILPKNIVMIGPTGVGKTEIARRLARLAGAPFVKVEASKFTEVGYVGRDVDSMIRDLVEASVKLVKEEETEKLRERAREAAEEKVLDALGYGVRPRPRVPIGGRARPRRGRDGGAGGRLAREGPRPAPRRHARRRHGGGGAPGAGAAPRMPFMAARDGGHGPGAPGHVQPSATTHRLDARGRREEAEAPDEGEGGARAPHAGGGGAAGRHGAGHPRGARPRRDAGIVFIDEIDKIAGGEGGGGRGPDVSREGVQRDLLPIVEGSTVSTKYGPGEDRPRPLHRRRRVPRARSRPTSSPSCRAASRSASSSSPCTREDLVRILKEPRTSLVRSTPALLATEGVDVAVQRRRDRRRSRASPPR